MSDLAAAHEFTWIQNASEIVRGYGLERLGSFDGGVSLLEQGVDIGLQMDTPMQIAWASVYLSELMTSCGQSEQARVHAQEAVMVSRKNGLRTVEVMSLQMMGRAQHRLRESRAFFEEALGLSIEHGLRPLTANIQFELGWTITEMGDSEGGAEMLAAANAERSELGLPSF